MSKQDLERGHYDNILGMVYFYRMSQILHKRIPLQKLQLSFVKESLEAVYQSFARVDPPAPKERNAWEEKMYENLCAGKNVYIQYKRDKGALDHIYSIMLTLALSDEHSVAAFYPITFSCPRGKFIFYPVHRICLITIITKCCSGHVRFCTILSWSFLLICFLRILLRNKKTARRQFLFYTSKSISKSSRVSDFHESCPGMTASATPRFISCNLRIFSSTVFWQISL